MSRFSIMMENEGLTTLEIHYNWKNDTFSISGLKEWDGELTWGDYNTSFNVNTPLTEVRCFCGDTMVKLIDSYGLNEHLEYVKELIYKGKHEGIEYFYNAELEISFIYCMHSSGMSINNGLSVIRAGGIRRHDLIDDEKDIILDGLNLSRAMSYKNAAARIPVGGSKIVVASDPIPLDDMERIGFISYCLDRTRSLTGPDMGFLPEHADVIRKFSMHITGGKESRIGPTGKAAAYGVYLAIKEAAGFRYGSSSLKDVTIAIQGLGALGFSLATYLAKEEPTLIVAEPDNSKIEALMAIYDKVEVVKPEKIYEVSADIFAPCAFGGVITEDRISNLSFDIIMGGANNQLAAASKEEEIKLARMLMDQGIVFQIDWMHNTGGVMAGWEEYINRENASFENIRSRIEAVCGKGTRENLEEAARAGITPTERAYKVVESKIYM